MNTNIRNVYEIREKFSQTWLTLTDIGVLFGKSPREMSFYLEQLGLRAFDNYHHQYLPTKQAQSQGWCTPTRSRRKALFYLWHKQKVSELLQEKASLQLLDEEDVEARELALQLLRYCKEYQYDTKMTFDPLREILLTPEMPTIMAWYLMEEEKKSEICEPNATHFMILIDKGYFHTINYELARLGSKIRLGEYDYEVGIDLGNEPAFADCDICREVCEMRALCT
jgi:hypothetical protein